MERRTLPQDQDQEAPLTLGWHQSCFLIILSAFLLYYQLCWWRWAEENSDCGNCCVLTVWSQLLCRCEEHVGWQQSMCEYSSIFIFPVFHCDIANVIFSDFCVSSHYALIFCGSQTSALFFLKTERKIHKILSLLVVFLKSKDLFLFAPHAKYSPLCGDN